ncbi:MULTISPECIES: right-handed parallel beta-helix repeat-containing protein [Micromonospora]|uniref:Right-handed parallel beta-helix repeat-containing protein n=1 Tax=Micromonospora solifontis TaxID=2487138 RepID=A0ABX9WF16_9ACTN|nr:MULTISPECIES: right-handed parallel beta-helix repeat-containing protein [Micromonospora]NES16674.1 right-handed parallel beta-helix repeat-containing protein [Micromonospora sp. PPF5-17B]NES37342.1 right-handed parallel beta-helix repeat-containing protein [Micromonospora solifontis]NES56770.1 right-handed parallel beta-helix repeat-containing protein [Micromonospora sp. PPF5-6]RNL98455.1 right-handed parallel beta-helix repeat-containing protein [Micromonospora solifontis]
MTTRGLSTAVPQRLTPVAGAPLWCDARDFGLTGDGVTNDQPALSALVDRLGDGYAADGRARVIWCPPGIYSIRDAGTVWRSGVSLIGAGPAATRFLLSNEGNRADPVPLAYWTVLQHGASRERHIADCTFADFEIDGSGVGQVQYCYLAKGLGIQYMVRGVFRNLYIHHTGASGLGCDFLQDSLIDGVVAVGCGRLDNGVEMGGAGIGVGVGGWGEVERLTIANCTTVGNGTNGIFLELQKDWWPPPRGYRIIGCHSQANRFGISDWGTDGLIVSSCTLSDNLEAGFDVSANGTAGIAGRGGLLTDCVIDCNVGDGISMGDSPGPYTIRGNRISRNGGYGYHEHDLGRGFVGAADDVVIDGNEIWENGLDGIRIDRPMTDAMVVNNRIRNNGRRCAPAASGAGESVRYGDRKMVDAGAHWPADGHRGKVVRIGTRSAVVVANTDTELTLAAVRPDSPTGWNEDTPPPGARYELPGPPPVRAGITVNAPFDSATVRANRIWDHRDDQTQTYGLWVTDRGSCLSCRVEENDLVGNAEGAVRLDTPPVGGHWRRNHQHAD